VIELREKDGKKEIGGRKGGRHSEIYRNGPSFGRKPDPSQDDLTRMANLKELWGGGPE